MFIQWCCYQMHIVKYYFKSFSVLVQSISHAMRERQRINTIFGRFGCESEMTSVFGCKIECKKRDNWERFKRLLSEALLMMFSRVTGHERCSPYFRCPELICFWHCRPFTVSCCAWLTWLFPSSFFKTKPTGMWFFFFFFNVTIFVLLLFFRSSLVVAGTKRRNTVQLPMLWPSQDALTR